MKKILPFLIAIILTVAVYFLGGGSYIAGGDDTRLYYVFPNQYLKYFAFNIVSDNTLAGANTGYAPVSYFAPIIAVMAVIKIIPLNTQLLMFGLNVGFGFLGFYFFLKLFHKENDHLSIIIKIFGSLFYVLSPFVFRTLYSHQMLTIYLVAIMPWCLYFLIRGYVENKSAYTLFALLIFSLFSSTLNTIPWWSAFGLVSIPLLIYKLLGINIKVIVKQTLIFGVAFLFVNFYWIFHFIYSNIGVAGLGGNLTYYSSAEFVADNLRIIHGVATLFSPLNIIFNSMQTDLIANWSWSVLIGGIFIFLALVASLFVGKDRKLQNYYLVFGCCFLLAWFLFSPNIGKFGPKLFLYLSKNLPFFTMYRNMFDKFSLALAFYFAALLTTGLLILHKNIKLNWLKVCVIILLMIVVGNTSVNELNVLKTKVQQYKFSGEFNVDYRELVNYVSAMDSQSRFVWLPLNSPTYAAIEDSLPGNYYSGLSPLRVLADKSDYAGRFSFISQNDLFLGDKLFEHLRNKDYEKVGKILQSTNAQYVIVTKERPSEETQNYLYDIDKKLLTYQSEDFYKEILGAKVKDFGNRYSLYEINPKYLSWRFFITDNVNKFPHSQGNVRVKKISSQEYDIQVENITPNTFLVFMDPYYKEWNLMLDNGEMLNSPTEVAYGYANAWKIDPRETGNTAKFKLVFMPQRFTKYANSVSIFSVGVILLYLAYQPLKSYVRRSN